jgi:hypothetical protein
MIVQAVRLTGSGAAEATEARRASVETFMMTLKFFGRESFLESILELC